MLATSTHKQPTLPLRVDTHLTWILLSSFTQGPLPLPFTPAKNRPGADILPYWQRHLQSKVIPRKVHIPSEWVPSALQDGGCWVNASGLNMLPFWKVTWTWRRKSPHEIPWKRDICCNPTLHQRSILSLCSLNACEHTLCAASFPIVTVANYFHRCVTVLATAPKFTNITKAVFKQNSD
jgi:hypothetical protein